MVHAAGVTGFNVRDKLPYQMSEEDERASDRVIDVNLKGAMALTRAALPFMTQATSHAQQHPRALVLISSVAGKECYAGSASYCASKWGLQVISTHRYPLRFCRQECDLVTCRSRPKCMNVLDIKTWVFQISGQASILAIF